MESLDLQLWTRIGTMNRPLTRSRDCGTTLSSIGGEGRGCTDIEISPVARPHGQVPNLNPNRNLARLRFLEIKSKITIKSARKPFRLNSTAVGKGRGGRFMGRSHPPRYLGGYGGGNSLPHRHQRQPLPPPDDVAVFFAE